MQCTGDLCNGRRVATAGAPSSSLPALPTNLPPCIPTQCASLLGCVVLNRLLPPASHHRTVNNQRCVRPPCNESHREGYKITVCSQLLFPRPLHRTRFVWSSTTFSARASCARSRNGNHGIRKWGAGERKMKEGCPFFARD